MASMINGCGTTLQGNAEPHPHGAYGVTTWIVLVFIPMIPPGSMRMLPVSQAHRPWYKRGGQQYRSIKVPLHMSNLWKGRAVASGLFLLFSIAGKL